MSFLDAIHPERRIDGFSKLSGTLTFYSFVRAIALRHGVKSVLDYGAGRGAFSEEQEFLTPYLRDLRFAGAHVCACDIDPIVKTHGYSDEQILIQADKPLPFADSAFDLVVSDMTFEHIANPLLTASELLRVLKPGGYICARTPNGYGYVAIIAGLAPNSWHVRLLRKVQPDRKAKDVFPTHYKMNTTKQIRKLFPSCEIYSFTLFGEPFYCFGNALLYRAMLILHRLLPPSLAPTLCLFIRKP